MERQKAISYALFGYNKERQENCFDFNSYLRGFMDNVRLARLLFPDWKVVLNTDESTYNAFKPLFDGIGIDVLKHPEAPLCKAMLWRLHPAFMPNEYSHVICRDTDSPLTYREAQCVQFWVNREKGLHAITDSVSHGIPLLGGMIGMRVDDWVMKFGYNWDDFMNIGGGMDFSGKGSDQTFLNNVVYPAFATKGSENIIQHYIKGYANTFLNGWYDKVPDIELAIPYEMSESNNICGHIGSAGAYSTALYQFLRKYKDRFTDILELEKQYPVIFYWTQDGTFE